MRLRLAAGSLLACLVLFMPCSKAQAGTLPPTTFYVQGQITQLLQLGAPNVIYVTVRTPQKQLVPFLVTKNTVILINGKPGTMWMLRVGDSVQANVVQNFATWLIDGVAPAPPPPPPNIQPPPPLPPPSAGTSTGG